MHYHAEIMLPPTTPDIVLAVEEVMGPFSQCEEEPNENAFWDWYQIGGRWAGDKLLAKLDKSKLDAFYAELKDHKVTVSPVVAGKQKLSPASQIPNVDALWQRFFPGTFERCPLFDHCKIFDNQFIPGDVMRLEEVSPEQTAERVIIALFDEHADKYQAKFMASRSFWNGVNSQDTGWDGKVRTALSTGPAYYKERLKLEPDWFVVTVDYHC